MKPPTIQQRAPVTASAVPRHLNEPRPLVAAATPVTGPRARENYGLRTQMPWQIRALFYAATIPELQYASNFYARMLQKIRIFPAYRDSDDKLTPITDGPPVDLLDRIQDPGGGRTALLGMYGKLQFITGECYLFGRNVDGNNAPEKWSVVWREELKFDDAGRVTHVLGPSANGDVFNLRDEDYKPLPVGSAVAYRMWTPSPRFSGWATSPFEGCMQVAEELLALTASVQATATSRLVKSKLLFLPQDMEPTPLDADGDEDPASSIYLQDLTAHLVAVTENPAAPESLAPFVTYMDGEQIGLIRDLTLHDPATDYLEKDLRKESIERLGRGLDLPPEVVDGMSSANHWAAWWISDDMWRSHGAPRAEQFCDDLSEAYLRPALREAGFDGWQEVVVGFDASAVVVNPDRSKDADQAMDRGQVSGVGYRVMKNIPEEWAPSEEEYRVFLAMKKVIIGEDGLPVPDSGGGSGIGTADEIARGDDPGTPDGEPGETSENTNLPASAFQGAAQLALYRCRELAGSRIRSKRSSCPGCLDEVQHLENSLVASALGAEGLVELGSPSPAALVAGGADGLRALLVSWGNKEEDAQTVAKMLEMHAARTLFHAAPPSIPASLEIL